MKKVYTDNSEKTVLITGCSSGIGECAALGLHGQGYHVIATARKQTDVYRLNRAGLISLPLDLADPKSIDHAVAQTLALSNGKLYALFNNGAYGQPGAVEDLPTEALRAQFETNFFGWHHLTRAILPIFRQQGHGRLIQNSSVLGYVTLKNRGAYNASKFAIEGLTDTLRLELAGTDIHVCLIEPGPIRSRFRENAQAQFFANIDIDNSPHRDTYLKVKERLQSDTGDQPFTLPAAAVLKKLIHILESPRPRARYRVTFPAQLFWYLKRLLPTRLLDQALIRIAD